MPYTRAQLLEAVRTDHPEFRKTPDNQLFAAIGTDHPDLAKGIAELNPETPYQSPVYPRGESSRTAGEVAQDQAAEVLKGIPEAVTGIPGALMQLGKMGWKAVTGDAAGAVSDAAAAGKGMLAPVLPIAKTLTGNAPSPESDEWKQGARASGTLLAGTVLPNAIAGALPVVSRAATAAVRAVAPSSGELGQMAAANKARALAPATLQGRADAGVISSEIAERGGASGLRGATIDRNIKTSLETSGTRVAAVENRLAQDVRPEMQTPKMALLREIDSAKAALRIPRTTGTAYPEAVAQLEDVRSLVDQLPDYVDFDQLIELRRQLDRRAEDAGAFGVHGDSLKADINRGVADLVRGKLNELDPELKSANHDYSVWRKAGDIVKRRELGETGKIGSGLPGRGAILDDVLATWGGHAMGGPIGGAVAEGVNLVRQSRGFANVKSALQQKLSTFLKPQQTAPAGLLTEGSRPLGAVPDTSFVRGAHAETALNGRPRLLTEGSRPMPPPEGSRLEVIDARQRIARDPKTGRFFKYWTTESKP